MTPEQQSAANMRGIVWMLVSMVFFIVGDALTKSVGAALPVGEIVAIRSLVAAVVLFPFVVRLRVLGQLPAMYSQPMLIRNIGEVSGTLLFVTSLVNIPIANATAIMQSTPLAITAAAALFLKDKVGWRRWTATVVGFFGALLIIRPGSADFSWWYLPAMVAILAVVLRDLGTRYIDHSVPTALITFLTFVLTALGAALMGLALGETWRMPDAMQALQLVIAGPFHIVGASFLVMSLRSGGEISVIIPFRYSIVMWSMLIGYLVWGQLPHPVSILGIVVVVGAGLYTVHREQVRRREQTGKAA